MVARKWEHLNQRDWLYAGKGKGANVAAWKQAFFAELAATMRHSAEYIQTLMDLVKAFDYVPKWLLVREAIALNYPLKILRLSIATYELNRVIRIGNVVSKTVTAVTGITAGSGFATTEMRLVLIRVVDRALSLYPTITPTLFVDDLAAAVCAPAKHAIAQMGGFIEYVARFITDTRQALSPTKCNVTASTKKIGDAVVARWKSKGILIHFQLRVKALGVGTGGWRQEELHGHANEAHQFHGQGDQVQETEEGGGGHRQTSQNRHEGHHVQQRHHGGAVWPAQGPKADGRCCICPGSRHRWAKP